MTLGRITNAYMRLQLLGQHDCNPYFFPPASLPRIIIIIIIIIIISIIIIVNLIRRPLQVLSGAVQT